MIKYKIVLGDNFKWNSKHNVKLIWYKNIREQQYKDKKLNRNVVTVFLGYMNMC